jgi:hypothetical protein
MIAIVVDRPLSKTRRHSGVTLGVLSSFPLIVNPFTLPVCFLSGGFVPIPEISTKRKYIGDARFSLNYPQI